DQNHHACCTTEIVKTTITGKAEKTETTIIMGPGKAETVGLGTVKKD
ncbi:18710_t:CDS:1, partial [Racocetra fulgida]